MSTGSIASTGDRRVRLGCVGVGAITSALVEAVLSGPHAGEVDVVLSPRSARRSAELDRRFDQVEVAPDNQSVVDSSDLVVLAVLPDQLAALCASLSFRTDQDIVSLVAGFPPSRLAAHVRPATAITQLIPLPMIALHTGPVVMCPPLPRVAWLLDGCGEVVSVENEDHLVALSCASATMSTFLAFENTVIDWLLGVGLPARQARDYAATLFQGLATETLRTELDQRAQMPQEHETPGGLNHYLRTSMTTAGTFSTLTQHLDTLHQTWSKRTD